MAEEPRNLPPAGDSGGDKEETAPIHEGENAADGGPDEGDTYMQPLHPPNNETLLPRKRSQATKSPVPPGALTPAASSAVNKTDEEDEAELGEGRAAVRRDMRSTPNEMKQANLSQLLDPSRSPDEGEDPGEASSSEVKPRASLNASFEAAAALGLVQEMKSNPKYTSPKRRKQASDEQQVPQTARKPPPSQPKLSSQSFTPLRPPQTQQKRNRTQVDPLLFSPRPMQGGEPGGRPGQMRPPRPSPARGGATPGRSVAACGPGGSAAAGAGGTAASANDPSSPLTLSPKFGPQQNLSSSNDSSASPGTLFRFHSFPASLPRVNPRVGAIGGGEEEAATGGSGKETAIPGSAARLKLRPKPPSPAMRQHHPQMPPPPSPASRRLFMKSTGSDDAGDSTTNHEASGDWSEATSIRSLTNERIRKSNVLAIPSHVSAPLQQHLGALDNLEEEEADTVVMDEDDMSEIANVDSLDADDKHQPQQEVPLPQTRLSFGSPVPGELSGEASSSSAGKKGLHESLETTLHPHTPRGQLGTEQFPNLKMSPIVRLADDDDHEMADHGDNPTKGSLDDDRPLKPGKVQPLFMHDASPILPRKSGQAVDMSANSSATMFSSGSAVDTTASTANINNTTMHSNMSNLTRPTARKLRPTPDTSAFDLGTPSQQSLGSKDSGFVSHKSGMQGPSSDQTRLLCPPTPMRTPAWAHRPGEAPGIKRANSLISTKVLAACPPNVMANLSSLEDSMLENDISGSTMDNSGMADGLQNLASSFAPVQEEKDENDENDSLDEPNADDELHMFRSLEDGSDQISPALAGGDGQQATAEKPLGGRSTELQLTSANLPKEDHVTSFADFDNLGILGSGAFADVYKVRSRADRKLYAIKRTRRQFRGVKDRERAMAEVHTMKRLQSALLSEAAAAHDECHSKPSSAGESGDGHHHHHSKSNYGLYLLFFIRAWQQDGFFYCQTELCSRATARHLRLSLVVEWERDVLRYPSLQLCMLAPAEEASSPAAQQSRLIPERALWQICHDISRGLFHIHSFGLVHYDIKPSNIFFHFNTKWGTICKIGDFGLAGDIGTKDDGQEGDTAYMGAELLTSSCAKHPGADIFSLGVALYELAASPEWTLPREGDRWHELRSGTHRPDLPPSRSAGLVNLISAMIRPDVKERPSAEEISELDEVKRASATIDSFLSRFINDVERHDSRREREVETAEEEARRRSSTPVASMLNHNAAGSDDATARKVRDLRTPTND
ncbi:hypothetical protein ACHAXT_004982 [Thalassiosira profunda]